MDPNPIYKKFGGVTFVFNEGNSNLFVPTVELLMETRPPRDGTYAIIGVGYADGDAQTDDALASHYRRLEYPEVFEQTNSPWLSAYDDVIAVNAPRYNELVSRMRAKGVPSYVVLAMLAGTIYHEIVHYRHRTHHRTVEGTLLHREDEMEAYKEQRWWTSACRLPSYEREYLNRLIRKQEARMIEQTGEALRQLEAA